ncbi:MAG TPA: SRPBCC domain-containing protein [Actinomycetota bacterium]
MSDELRLTREAKIAAPPEVVFTYFTDIEKLLRWNAQEGEVDARVGGAYRFRVVGNAWAVGEFVEIDPPRRLVYTWGWEDNAALPPGSTVVEVTFEASAGYTLVRLTHRDLPTAGAVEQHGEGWDHYLARLGVAASGGDPGPDPWSDVAPS